MYCHWSSPSSHLTYIKKLIKISKSLCAEIEKFIQMTIKRDKKKKPFVFSFFFSILFLVLSYYTKSSFFPLFFSLFKLFKVSQNAKREGYGPGGIFEIPKLKSFNGTKHCVECGVVFNLFKQKYHCRNCGKINHGNKVFYCY